MLVIFGLIGALIWIVVAVLPWRPWSTRERLEPKPELDSVSLEKLTVLIPARNEENEIGPTLKALQKEDPNVSVVLIDDQSTDNTQAKAQAVGLSKLKIVEGKKLPENWAGKIWALEQGLKEVQTPFVLLLDADIEVQPGILKSLVTKLESESLGYASLMAKLSVKSFWEKLLLPFYIFSFKLLYPFSLSNSGPARFATAAGGCNLVQRKALQEIGGFASIKGAFIDDCSLAKKIKEAGFKGWVGLTHSVKSHRNNAQLSTIWSMIVRFAYTYLKYSPILLILCVLLLFSAYIALPLVAFSGSNLDWNYRLVLSLGLLCLFGTYLPTLRFYGLSYLWSLLLPLSGSLYLLMTLDSAFRYYLGRKTQWKGRVYSKNDQAASEKVA